MSDEQLLLAAVGAIGAMLVVTCAATALGKLVRGVVDGRARRADARVRPVLVRLVAGAEAGPVPGGRGADGRAVERIATELLGKLRGEAYESLVAVLERRGVLAGARRRLHRPGAVGRARAAELLGAATDRGSVPELLELLRADRRGEVRVVAARALGRIGSVDAVPALLVSLDHGVPTRTVAQAVLQIGPPAEPILRRELQSGDARARALAAHVLGFAGSVGSGRAIAAAITTDPDPAVRANAAASAGRLGVPCAVDALVAALGAGRTNEERAASAEALGRMSATDATDVLAQLVDGPDVRVARAAACALASMGDAGRAYLEAFSEEGGAPAEHAREALRSAA